MINLKFKTKYILLLIFTLIIGTCLFYLYNHFYQPDLEFVNLIKNMALKNHENPSLFLEKYNSAATDEEKLKIVLTNNFYDCIYKNGDNIRSKLDVNLHCGHYIKFKK